MCHSFMEEVGSQIMLMVSQSHLYLPNFILKFNEPVVACSPSTIGILIQAILARGQAPKMHNQSSWLHKYLIIQSLLRNTITDTIFRCTNTDIELRNTNTDMILWTTNTDTTFNCTNTDMKLRNTTIDIILWNANTDTIL